MGDHRRADGPARRGVPVRVPTVAAIVGVVCLVGIGAALILFSDKGDRRSLQILGLIVTTVPGLLALAYSERASKDIRNGVVVEKVREGTVQAIREEQVMTRVGPAVTAELAALTELVLTNREIAGHLEQVLPSRPVMTNPPSPT